MSLDLGEPWYLLALPLALIPWWQVGRRDESCAWHHLLPDDLLSKCLQAAEKVLLSGALVFLIVALAEPQVPDRQVERIGRGAQMVVLLDRSNSMEQRFDRTATILPQPVFGRPGGDTKGAVARRLLSEFAARRKTDVFGMVVFSTKPIAVLPLTRKPEIIQSAISAGNIGRGLAETNVGEGLKRAFEFFAGRPYTGSRIVLLISDGAATLDLLTREQIRQLAERLRVALYWLFIETPNSPGLFDDPDQAAAPGRPVPHRALHEFFLSLETPYRVYTAKDPQALRKAIADVSALQNLPLHYRETIHAIDVYHWFYLAASLCLVPVLIGRMWEVRK